MTIRQLADQWMGQYVRPKLKPRTVADYEKLLTKHILPALGHLTVAGLTRADVTALHVSMKDTPRRANYTVRTVQGMMTYACDNGLRPPLDNPVRKLKLYRERARERFLSEVEIGTAADAITAAECDGIMGPHAAAGLRLALFTGARSGEVTAIEWRHIDWQRRFVRLPDSKTNEPRTIHLSDAAIEVIKTLPRVGKFVIAGAKPDEAYKNLSRAWIKTRDRTPGLEDVRLHVAAFLCIAGRRAGRVVADDWQAVRPQSPSHDPALCASCPRCGRRCERSAWRRNGSGDRSQSARASQSHQDAPAGTQMSKITLRKAVELLHKGGNSIEVAVIRLRQAATAGRIRSWGLSIGKELCGNDAEYFETEHVNAGKYYCAWNYGKIDWEHSTIEIPGVPAGMTTMMAAIICTSAASSSIAMILTAYFS